jgi:hypothetical protein
MGIVIAPVLALWQPLGLAACKHFPLPTALTGVSVSEPPPEDADGDDGPTDAGMTQTDVYIEQKERKQQKKYDSDDDGEPDRQGKKKKMKNVARGFGSLPFHPPAPSGLPHSKGYVQKRSFPPVPLFVCNAQVATMPVAAGQSEKRDGNQHFMRVSPCRQ